MTNKNRNEPQDPLFLIFARNAFYQRQFYLALVAFLISLIVIGVLIWIAVFIYKNPPSPIYFATDKVGRLVPNMPVNLPNMTNDEVISWVQDAVQTVNSYDFVNYRSQLQSAQNYFTSYGWEQFKQALKSSNNLNALINRKMIIQAQISGPPQIVTEGLLKGSYAWKISLPVLVTYRYPPYDGKSQYSNALTISVIVVRQDLLQSYKGLGIVQMISSLANNAPGSIPEISNVPSN
jgi:intracellular multiplication protein IcmL